MAWGDFWLIKNCMCVCVNLIVVEPYCELLLVCWW